MLLSRFSEVFYVDASTKETIRADLSQIALAKGIGESETATLDWLSGQREEWLLLLDNADDPTLDLLSYFPLCSHGNILITSRNRDTCFNASQSCQVSDMRPEEAKDLLLKIARLDNTNENEALAATIVEVHLLSLSSRSMLTIVQELGHLALAVVQAGGYIFRSGCDISLYLGLYRTRRGEF